MASGTKRPYDDDSHDRRSKPRDWRDAFLDDNGRSDRRRDGAGRSARDGRDEHRDGYRERERDRGHHRSGGYDRREEHRDRDRYDSHSRSVRDQYHDRDRGHGRYHDRDSERHGGSLRYDRDPRDDRRQDDRRRPAEAEEGEIRVSPPNTSDPSRKPKESNGKRVGFQSISLSSEGKATKSSKSEQESEPSEPIVVLEEETDPDKILEERRRKREEILAKFKNGSKPESAPSEAATPAAGSESVTSGTTTAEKTGTLTGTTTGATPLLKQLVTKSVASSSAATPVNIEPSLPSTPLGKEIDLTKDEGSENNQGEQGPGMSAADYDPTGDKKADEVKRQHDAEFAAGTGEPVKERSAPAPAPAEDEWEEVEVEEDDEDDDVDMFAAFGDDEVPKKKRKVIVRRRKNANGVTETIAPKKKSVLEVVDNLDDTDGYYRITPGEILDDGRYQVTITLGKGMFSGVVKAKVLKAVGQERRQDVVGKEVAIKVIRSQESMYVAGRKEAQILKRLNDADPEDKKHIVRMENVFEHRGHLCIVTESLSMNLRDVIKRFGKDVGLNMRAVRAYAHQMFLALSLFRKCDIVHADIKPDNILVSENKAVLKVCDLGSAADVTEGEPTPYLVSRFYRAPEIILGLPYDCAIDVWSVACTLYELYTGKILFPGRSNNHMLLLQMEVKGKMNHRMIKKAAFGEMHFDESNNFLSVEKDKITGEDVLKTLVISKATRDLRSRLLPPSSVQLKMKDDEVKTLYNFVDLLDKCLHLDPARRLTPREALVHPFLAGH